MHLEKFDYRYAASGDAGGLKRVDFDFQPFDPKAVTERAEMKRITREHFEHLRRVCDEILVERFQCECKPDFSDSPVMSRGGYLYSGGVVEGASNLLNLATVHFTLAKAKVFNGKISIDTSFDMHHVINITIMGAMLELATSIDPDAQNNIDALRKLLDSAGDVGAKVNDLLGSDAE